VTLSESGYEGLGLLFISEWGLIDDDGAEPGQREDSNNEA